jgi:hypothetical protein
LDDVGIAAVEGGVTEGGNRKFLAKRFNEHVKLLATLFNALSIATFGAAFVVPLAQGQYGVLSGGHWILIFAALALHLAGHAALRFMRSED